MIANELTRHRTQELFGTVDEKRPGLRVSRKDCKASVLRLLGNVSMQRGLGV